MSLTINVPPGTASQTMDDSIIINDNNSITLDFSHIGSYSGDGDYYTASGTVPTLTISDLTAINNVSGTNGYAYPNVWTNTGTATVAPWITSNPTGAKLQVNGEDADIEINGESLMGSIREIRERLNLLTVNPALESEWQELRELGDRYRALEKHIKEKQSVWDKLKAMPPPNVD